MRRRAIAAGEVGGAPSRTTPLRPDGDAPLRVGISSCLLGREVRWDAGHERNAFLADVLGPFVEWVAVCPELEVGMGVPREPVRLVANAAGTAMLGVRSGRDWTGAMRRWAAGRLDELEPLELSGYVLKKDSPSCGMERVRVYEPSGTARRRGRGLFAEALLARWPALPVEEEGRLEDPVLRENFIERLVAYRRLRSLFAGRWTLSSLVAFQARHELQLLAHEPAAAARLGRLVAGAKGRSRDAVRREYEEGFMTALSRRSTRSRHVNVLEHCLGTFRERLDRSTRAALAELVED